MKIEDELGYISDLKLLLQTKEYKNIRFHKLKLKEKGVWKTYWYLDRIDIKKLTDPSKLDKRLYFK